MLMVAAFGQVLIPSKVPLGTEKGATYGYWQTVPVSPTTVKGVMIFVPGHGERGTGSSADLDKVSRIGIQKVIYQAKWTRQDLIVISAQYPTTADKMYHVTLDNFITHLQNKFRPIYGNAVNNIYMVGISGGGITLLNYITEHSRVKAAIEISGSGSASDAPKAIFTKLWVIHGEDDTTIKSQKGLDFVNAYNKEVARFNALKLVDANKNPITATPALFTLIPLYGHESGVWDRVCANPKFIDWMLK